MYRYIENFPNQQVLVAMSTIKKSIASAYDSVATFYNSRANQSFFEKEKAILSKFLENHNWNNVLDIGAGTCRFYEVVAGKKGMYVALDLSRHMLENGRKHYSIDPIVADAEHLPLVPDKFSLVVMLEMSQFFPSPSLAFREISRVMSDPGIAVVTIPNIFWSIPVKIMLLLGLTHWPAYSKESKSIEQYEHTILDSGLEILEKDGFKLLPFFPIVSKLIKLKKTSQG